VVLAVTDHQAMTERLGAVADAGFAFAVRDDFSSESVPCGRASRLRMRLPSSRT
jgi:hypothetical protein